MEFINIHTSAIDSMDFIRCAPPQRAAWLLLLRFCAGQENGGKIVGAREWGDTTWQQLCRVKLREVKNDCGLFFWDGSDLVVNFYPLEQEKKVISNRKVGGLGGRPKKPKANHVDNHVDNHVVQECENERKGKERKEEGKEIYTRAQYGDLFPPGPPTNGPRPDLADDEAKWRYEGHMWPWAQEIKKVTSKIGAKNWTQWKTIHDGLFKGNTKALTEFITGMSADKRWPDDIQTEYSKRRPDAVAELNGRKVHYL